MAEDSTLDPAVQLERKALRHQEKMNSFLERNDSPIQQFYDGSTVFLTGGSGFLGKQYIEKLLRACNIKKIFVLIREKKGKCIQDRMDTILQDPLYDLLRSRKPDFASKIVPIEGDVTELRLGISKEDWQTITEEVDSVTHMAATVRFDEAIRVAITVNVRGTREVIHLARECKRLKNFVYVSTAYSHATSDRIGKDVLEQLYPCPVPPDAMIELAESVTDGRLDSIADNLIQGWPNTYTFTKALAEELVRKASDLPTCIVRPPIVLPCYYEPSPGWLDLTNIAGPSGVMLGIGLGIVHVFSVDKYKRLAFVPLDIVNNAIIAAGWDAAEKRKDGDVKTQVYTVANYDNFYDWKNLHRVIGTKGSKLTSPLTAWYCFLIEASNKWLYWFLTWVLHYLPAYILDALFTLVGKKPKEINSFVDVYRKMDKMSLVYNFFTNSEWRFRDHNVQSMLSKMTDADVAIFNCDVSTVDYEEYFLIWLIGIRKYILKDGLKDTVIANKRQKLFAILFVTIYVILFYLIWKIVYGISCVINYVLF